MDIKFKVNQKIKTKNSKGIDNGYLIPIYNVNEGFFEEGDEPKQVYLTVVESKEIKGPHLHFKRNGCFTCIKGNARFILKVDNSYKEYFSGEDYQFSSVIVPKGVPAALQNIGNNSAYILNMPSPGWSPEMNDEHTADFSDFDFENF